MAVFIELYTITHTNTHSLMNWAAASTDTLNVLLFEYWHLFSFHFKHWLTVTRMHCNYEALKRVYEDICAVPRWMCGVGGRSQVQKQRIEALRHALRHH